jgi:hypothetical protein
MKQKKRKLNEEGAVSDAGRFYRFVLVSASQTQ